MQDLNQLRSELENLNEPHIQRILLFESLLDLEGFHQAVENDNFTMESLDLLVKDFEDLPNGEVVDTLAQQIRNAHKQCQNIMDFCGLHTLKVLGDIFLNTLNHNVAEPFLASRKALYEEILKNVHSENNLRNLYRIKIKKNGAPFYKPEIFENEEDAQYYASLEPFLSVVKTEAVNVESKWFMIDGYGHLVEANPVEEGHIRQWKSLEEHLPEEVLNLIRRKGHISK